MLCISAASKNVSSTTESHPSFRYSIISFSFASPTVQNLTMICDYLSFCWPSAIQGLRTAGCRSMFPAVHLQLKKSRLLQSHIVQPPDVHFRSGLGIKPQTASKKLKVGFYSILTIRGPSGIYTYLFDTRKYIYILNYTQKNVFMAAI